MRATDRALKDRATSRIQQSKSKEMVLLRFGQHLFLINLMNLTNLMKKRLSLPKTMILEAYLEVLIFLILMMKRKKIMINRRIRTVKMMDLGQLKLRRLWLNQLISGRHCFPQPLECASWMLLSSFCVCLTLR